jgi:hypothetical protein
MDEAIGLAHLFDFHDSGIESNEAGKMYWVYPVPTVCKDILFYSYENNKNIKLFSLILR